MQNVHSLHIRINTFLAKALVFFTPIMFFNPMNPIFMRLQFSDLISLVLIPSSLLMALKLKKFSFNFISLSLLIFLVVGFIASLNSVDEQMAYVELLKFVFLTFMAWSVFFNATNLNIESDLLQWFSLSFVFIIMGGIVGSVFFIFGYESFLVHSTKIIGVALGIEHILPNTPRITSFLKPTANMTAFYIATSLLLSVDYLFRKYKYSLNNSKRLIFLITIIAVTFFTMSRGLIGVIFAIWLGIYFLKWEVPFRKSCLWLLGALFISSLISLQIFTIFYPLGLSVIYVNDPNYEKELVDLGSKIIPNPVYFLREGIGSEKITLSITYAYNHYLWLKYAAFKIFELNPFFGIGLGCFSLGVLNLSDLGIVSSDLTQYSSSQSQFFTTIAETGLFGLLSVVLLISSLVFTSLRFHRISNDSNFSLLNILTLLVCIVISLDADVLSFRWLWIIFAILIALQLRSAKEII